MRRTMLLESAPAGSGSWPAARTTGTTTRATTTGTGTDVVEGDRSFDEVVAVLLPCRNNDPELWFAEQTARVEAAKALCRECPIIAGCLAGALEREEPWGVWGGEVFVGGTVVATKRGRGRPRKQVAV